jgi:hypothetical protein
VERHVARVTVTARSSESHHDAASIDRDELDVAQIGLEHRAELAEHGLDVDDPAPFLGTRR